MGRGFKNFSTGITVVPHDGSLIDSVGGDLQVLTSDGKLYYTNESQSSTSPLVAEDQTATLTNKTISGSDNTITNIPNSALSGNIARSKIASASANNVVINDGSGNLSQEATLATTRGGTALSSYTTGDIIYASGSNTLSKLPIGSSTNILTVSGGVPAWQSFTASIPDDSVSTAKIQNLAVTTGKINDLGVTTGKINDLAVTTGKINDLAVTTGKINDGAVTQAKRAALGQQISSSSGNFAGNASSFTDITNMSVSITTTGRPVMLMCISASTDGGGGSPILSGGFTVISGGSGNTNAQIQFMRGATQICTSNMLMRAAGISSSANINHPASVFQFIDIPAAGTYTYKVRYRLITGDQFQADDCKLVAYEL